MKVFIEILDFEWKETPEAESLFCVKSASVHLHAIVQPSRKNV